MRQRKIFLFAVSESYSVTMNRHGDLVLHSLLNGDVVLSTGNGGVRVGLSYATCKQTYFFQIEMVKQLIYFKHLIN